MVRLLDCAVAGDTLVTPRASALATGLLRVNRRPSETFTSPNGLQVVVLLSSRAR